jgi:hypothetical protein
MFNNPKINFVSPLRSVGTVVSNGGVSKEMVNHAYTNRTPKWGLAENIQRDMVGVVKRGEIIYQLHDTRAFGAVSSCSVDPQYMERENTTLKGLTILNGQGDNALSNFDFMNTIQVLGIVEMSNEDNHRGLFNVVSGGIHDVRNNGNETINVGDYVYAYAPDPLERKQGGGKMTNADEKHGIVKLWYKPYHPEMHRFQMKQIYECLKDVNKAKNYMPLYRRHCNQFVDATAGMAMTYFKAILPSIRKALSGADTSMRASTDHELCALFLAKAGHSEFRTHPNADLELKQEIIDYHAVPFSSDSKNKAKFLFSPDDDNLTKRDKDLMKKLNSVQQKSPGLYLETMSYLLKQTENLIMGQAKSSARPGFDFSLMLTRQ